MDEFEFSVDISDRDWQGFFTQCEECNVLPPALAGLEDSGMSDLDDLGTLFGKRVKKCEVETCHSEEAVADGPPMCEGSPQELYLSKHHFGGMESILSDSEEDIHLQSVNMFFEQMKSLSDSQKPAQQNHMEAIKNLNVKGELTGPCSSTALSKHIPKLNSTDRVSTSRRTYSVLTDESSSESSTNLYVKHPYLKTKLFIESSSENTANEKMDNHYPRSKPISSIPHLTKVTHIDKETSMCDEKDYSPQKTVDLRGNTALVVNGKWTEDKSTQVSQSECESPHKPLSKESSPCASIKRKRRKKRRLSVEPAESLFRRERLCSSEDELFTWRRAIDPCFSKDFSCSGIKHQEVKCSFMPPLGQSKLSSSLPAGVEAVCSPHHRQYESTYTQEHFGHSGLTNTAAHSTESDVLNSLCKSSEVEKSDNASEQDRINDKEEIKVEEIHLDSKGPSKNICRNEVKSITNAIFQGTESDDLGVAIGRSVKVSGVMSVMREEAENEKVPQCQRVNEPHQQLETQCLITYQSQHIEENMTPPPSGSVMSLASATELLDHTRNHVSQNADSAAEEASAILSNPDMFLSGTRVKHQNDAKPTDLSPKHELHITTMCVADTVQDKDEGNKTESSEMHQNVLQALPESENPLHSSSFTSLSPCHLPGTILALPKESIPESLENSSMSNNGPNFQEEIKEISTKHGTVLPLECLPLSHDSEVEPCWNQVEVAMTNSQSMENNKPEVKSSHTVFAMSSFWKEMEKLTINDILGCRKESKTQAGFLPSLQETDDIDFFSLSDSGCCSQADEWKLANPDPADCNPSYAVTRDSSGRGVLWESEPVPMRLPPQNIYENTITFNDITEPTATPGLRRISKKISVQNLRALEADSFGYKYKSQSTIKPLDEDLCSENGYILEEPLPEKDPRPSSMIENFRLSITDICSYFFNENQSNACLDSTTENVVNNFPGGGDSEPENYDHFFSEFDTNTFFYTDEAEPEVVPIFSCSRSSKSKMEYHDAYDYFLVSSSENSSSESDEEDAQEHSPIRVVTRLTRKPSSKDIVTDAYEHFYTDRDLQQDFFKANFSFRNVKLTDGNAHKQEPADALTVEPQKQESRSFHIKAMPITVLGNQDTLFPDSLLRNFDDQIFNKLQQPPIYQNLQSAVANPNLDAPLSPLKQADMCLICIAFASWVLKTADPQVGDAWKTVLLANVSALSAIRYLRRYVKGETTAGERKPSLKTLCCS